MEKIKQRINDINGDIKKKEEEREALRNEIIKLKNKRRNINRSINNISIKFLIK